MSKKIIIINENPKASWLTFFIILFVIGYVIASFVGMSIGGSNLAYFYSFLSVGAIASVIAILLILLKRLINGRINGTEKFIMIISLIIVLISGIIYLVETTTGKNIGELYDNMNKENVNNNDNVAEKDNNNIVEDNTKSDPPSEEIPVDTNQIYYDVFSQITIGLTHNEVVTILNQYNLQWEDRGGEAGSEMYRILARYEGIPDDWIIITYTDMKVSGAELNINGNRVDSI